MGGISNEAIAAIEAHNRVEYDQTASLDLTRRRISETKELQDEKDAEEAKELSQFSEEAEELGTQIRSTRKGNETFGTKVESVNLSNATYENLAKVLRELAKNGKINYSWTVDDWKCSPREI
jgi:alanyl-tRNA synthetase